jgi:steroid delta-isomerase-like uncharacterized protein
MSEDPRIALVRSLFAAWSSGDADAPADLIHHDAVLDDLEGGAHHGWPAIRDFFAGGLQHWPDLELVPEEFWTNERGVALTWTMSATIPDDRFGPENRGRTWRSPGMSYIVIEDGKVRFEMDYHSRNSVARSLQR